MATKLDSISDKDFCRIIQENNDWNNIARSLGYSRGSATSIREKVLERCEELGIHVNIGYISPILNMTRSELFGNRKNWQSARTAIRKLADTAYNKSEKPKACVICGYDKHIEIAHIKAVSDFDDDSLISEINDVNNLIALCPNHHWEFDNGFLSEEDRNKIYRGMEE